MSTVVQQHRIDTINNETGEVTSSSTSRAFKTVAEPNYIKLYIQDISYLNNLPVGTDRLIYALLPYVNYNQEIYVNSHNKKKIAEELGVTVGHIGNRISKLAKLEVLIRVDRGVYELNTYLFGKGSWKDILKHRNELQISMFYDWKNGRTINIGDSNE